MHFLVFGELWWDGMERALVVSVMIDLYPCVMCLGDGEYSDIINDNQLLAAQKYLSLVSNDASGYR
jgi:hypothetical protein